MVMIPRSTVCALLAALALPAFAADISVSTQFGPPTIYLEQSETLRACRQALVQLPPGETDLALPVSQLGVEPADIDLDVRPADCVRLSSVISDADRTRWVVEASRGVEARLEISYPITGLSWALGYAANLSESGGIDLSASLKVTNGTGRDLTNARLVGEFERAELSLEAGESVTVDQPWVDARFAADEVARSLVYDHARHGDRPVEVLTIAGTAGARSTPLPPGDVRIYAGPETGGDFITQTSIGYIPAREPLELNLGPASGVTITRTLEESKEVDEQTDARNRVVLFDLLETWVLEVRNLRIEPIEILIREHHEGAWKLEECSVEPERPDAETLEFDLTVEPDQRSEVSFRLRHLNRQP